jgi:polysaccharide export outer membrane protein
MALGMSTMLVALSSAASLAGGLQSQSFSSPSGNQSAMLSNGGVNAPTMATPQFGTNAPATTITRSDYVIGPEDVIEVDVFDVPNLSRTVQVTSTGRVLLPLLGDVSAAGQTVDQLSNQIQTAYGDRYLRDPRVTVTVKDSASLKVTVDGAVIQPGVYAISTDTTLMKAIALAKGPDMKLADVNKVAIFRTVGQRRSEAVFDLEDIREGKAVDPQLMANDIVVVDTSAIRRFLQDISPIAPFAALGAL